MEHGGYPWWKRVGSEVLSGEREESMVLLMRRSTAGMAAKDSAMTTGLGLVGARRTLYLFRRRGQILIR